MDTNCVVHTLDKFIIDLIVVSALNYTLQHGKDTLMLGLNETVTVSFTDTHLCTLWYS